MYNVVITIHALLMIFLLVMPAIYGGLGNTFIVVKLGSSEVSYPRINNLSVVILPLSYAIIFMAIQ